MAARVPMAGFLATAVTYGPARMGYGLFLPEFRAAFDLSAAAAGAIASAAFAAFLLALPAASLLTSRAGPRAPVLSGAALACAGMGLVTASWGLAPLVAGVILAAASAGLAWAPYNDAVERAVPEPSRPVALSVVSTGTTVGIALAGLLALAVAMLELDWRWAWGAFALAAAAMGAANLAALRGLPGAGGLWPIAGRRPSFPWRRLARREAAPLYLSALSFGVTSAAYISFAGEAAASALGVARIGAPIVFVAYGAGGLVGLAAGWIEGRVGLAPLLRAVFATLAASCAMIALVPDSWAGVAVSAALQGACVMTFSAVLAFWTLRVFPDLPAPSFTAVLMALASGSVAGPALAGPAIDALGGGTAFLAAAALSLGTLPLFGARLTGRHAPA